MQIMATLSQSNVLGGGGGCKLGAKSALQQWKYKLILKMRCKNQSSCLEPPHSLLLLLGRSVIFPNIPLPSSTGRGSGLLCTLGSCRGFGWAILLFIGPSSPFCMQQIEWAGFWISQSDQVFSLFEIMQSCLFSSGLKNHILDGLVGKKPATQCKDQSSNLQHPYIYAGCDTACPLPQCWWSADSRGFLVLFTTWSFRFCERPYLENKEHNRGCCLVLTSGCYLCLHWQVYLYTKMHKINTQTRACVHAHEHT